MLKTIPADQILFIFAKVLDGIEAAHLQGAVHRDLKPENLLYDIGSKMPAVADFGIASFTEDQIATLIETAPTQRLANFLYAAPEQRTPGRKINLTADIYALGLMLNEAFTSTVPHGTEYSRIGALHKQYGYLDVVVEKAIRQNPSERYPSVAEMRSAIAAHHAEFLSRQKLSEFSDTVIPVGEVDDPLAHKAPVLVGADWDNNVLTLTLDRPVNHNWVDALRNMGNYTSVMNVGPERFTFDERIARVSVRSEEAQRVIDFFKTWLPRATQTLKSSLEQAAEQETRKRREELARKKAAEEMRLKTVQSLKI
jgi:serine/threonine protein kinase